MITVNNRYKLYYENTLRSLLRSKFILSQPNHIPMVTRLRFNCLLNNNSDLDVNALFCSLMVGRRLTLTRQQVKRVRYEYLITTLFTEFSNKKLYGALEKFIYGILPYKEIVTLTPINITHANVFSMIFNNIVTYSETTEIFNNINRVVVDNVSVMLNIGTNSLVTTHIECLLRMLQLAVRCYSFKSLKRYVRLSQTFLKYNNDHTPKKPR